MTDPDANAPARRDEPVVEPEVLPSLEEAERSSGGRPGGANGPFGQGGLFGPGGPFSAHGPFGAQGAARPAGCTAGPGCGCIGLPLALAAGAVVSALLAVLWLLSLGRVPVSLYRLAQQARRGKWGRG